MKKLKCLLSIKWWTKDYCLRIVVAITCIIFFLICFFIHLRLIGTIDFWYIVQDLACAFGCSGSMYLYYPMIIKHFIPPKKILLWWTSYYNVRIVSIICSILIFFIMYFGIFIYDNNWPIQTLIFFSTIYAMSGGFIFAFIYYFIANAVSKSKNKSSEDTDIKKTDKPKYITSDWWKYKYCFRIIGVIGILSSIVMHFITMFDNIELNLLIVLENFSIVLLFSIFNGIVLAFVYRIIASIIYSVYRKIKDIKQNHLTKNM